MDFCVFDKAFGKKVFTSGVERIFECESEFTDYLLILSKFTVQFGAAARRVQYPEVPGTLQICKTATSMAHSKQDSKQKNFTK